MTVSGAIEMQDVAILTPGDEQMAVARVSLARGTMLNHGDRQIVLASDIPRGHRFALRELPAGELLRQFGYPIALSRGISQGELLTADNSEASIPAPVLSDFVAPPATRLVKALQERTFMGYRREGNRFGTRNYYLVIPTSMCAAETARQVAAMLDEEACGTFAELDDVVAIPHTEGCGCASPGQIDRLLTVLAGFMRHPNVGGCMVIDLGCEQSDRARLQGVLGDGGVSCLKPVDWLTIQQSGGTGATISQAMSIIRGRLSQVAAVKREPCPLSGLLLGTECGASDAFSGITANPVVGDVADQVIRGGGGAILSEIPEMLGTYAMLFSRFRTLEVAQKFQQAVDWYLDLAQTLGLNISDNLVPKNIAGGLFNSYLKSLGAVLKGGTSAIEAVIGYGEPACGTGLSIMQGPGGDLESVTGLVSSGANLICFTTGYGAISGSAICPVIKVSSTTETWQAMPDDIDFNAGRMLDGETRTSLADELLELLTDVASGKQTATERLKQRQFQVWTAGKLSL